MKQNSYCFDGEVLTGNFHGSAAIAKVPISIFSESIDFSANWYQGFFWDDPNTITVFGGKEMTWYDVIMQKVEKEWGFYSPEATERIRIDIPSINLGEFWEEALYQANLLAIREGREPSLKRERYLERELKKVFLNPDFFTKALSYTGQNKSEFFELLEIMMALILDFQKVELLDGDDVIFLRQSLKKFLEKVTSVIGPFPSRGYYSLLSLYMEAVSIEVFPRSSSLAVGIHELFRLSEDFLHNMLTLPEVQNARTGNPSFDTIKFKIKSYIPFWENKYREWKAHQRAA